VRLKTNQTNKKKFIYYDYLQGFFNFEILRGKCGLDEFELNRHIDKDLVQFPTDVVTLDEVIERAKGNMKEKIYTPVKPGKTLYNNKEYTDATDSSIIQRSLVVSAICESNVHFSTAAHSFERRCLFCLFVLGR
jgi:hypothetical protein